MIFANFQLSGYIPDFRMFVNICFSGGTIDSLLIISILDDIPSGPLALAELSPRICARMSSLSTSIDFSRLSVMKEKAG